MGIANRVVKNTGILYARMAITVFFSLYATRLILKALGVADFGIFNVVGGAISMLTFLNAAMAGATQRFMSYAEGAGDFQQLKTIFNVSIVLHIVIAVLVLILLEGAGYFLFTDILKIQPIRLNAAKFIYQFAIVSTIFTIVSVPYDAVINAHENMLLFAILGIIESILKLAISIYIVYANYDKLITFGLLIALLSIFLLMIRILYCKKKYPECEINFRMYFSKSKYKEMTGFAGWSFLGSSSSMLTHFGQGIIMNIFFGTVVNAAQGVANQITGQLGSFATTMLKALNPIIDKSEGAGNRTLMLRASMMGSKLSFLLLMFFYIPVIIEMPYIFELWLRNVPDYAVIFCRFLLMRNLIEQLFVTLSSSISAVGNIRKYQIYTTILNCIPLIICYFLFKINLPPYSLYIVYIIYSIATSVITLRFAATNCNLSINEYLSDVVVRCVITFIAIIVIASIPFWFMNQSFIRLCLTFFTSTISFLIFVWLVSFSEIEKGSIKQMVQSILGKTVFFNKYLVKLNWISKSKIY